MHAFKTFTAGLAVATFVAAGAVRLDAVRTPGGQDQSATLTGCLRSGSDPSVFILRGASGGEMRSPRDYLLVDVAQGVNLGASLNRQVAITGRVWPPGEGPAAPSAARVVRQPARSRPCLSERLRLSLSSTIRRRIRGSLPQRSRKSRRPR